MATLTQEEKIFAHELTMEYVKESNLLKDSSADNIEEKIDTIAEVSSAISDAIYKNKRGFCFL